MSQKHRSSTPSRSYSRAKIPASPSHSIIENDEYIKDGHTSIGRSDSIASYTRTKKAKSHKYDTQLKWKSVPKKCLLVKKIHDFQCTIDLLNVAQYLISDKKINIYLEANTYSELEQLAKSTASDIDTNIKSLALKIISSPLIHTVTNSNNIGFGIHFIVVLGGDGTLLYLVSLFHDHQHVPPIICFQRGSLGFLAPFQFKNYKQTLTKICDTNEPSSICIRMRLTARIWRDPDNVKKEETAAIAKPTKVRFSDENKSNITDPEHHRNWSAEIGALSKSPSLSDHDETSSPPPAMTLQRKSTSNLFSKKAPTKTKKMKTINDAVDHYSIQHDTDILFTKTQTIFPDHICNDIICHALNEVLIHRDNNASMMTANLFIDGDECTVIQADGMIFSTPTGSTAYNISAGGSLISPTVPCIALTPICPHTLSFRPVVVAEETIIHIQIPKKSRYKAIISFDGRNHITLERGDVVEIMKCPYPVPTFKSARFNVEWFHGLVEKFNWNKREIQKPFDAKKKESNEDDEKNKDETY